MHIISQDYYFFFLTIKKIAYWQYNEKTMVATSGCWWVRGLGVEAQKQEDSERGRRVLRPWHMRTERVNWVLRP